MEESQPEAVQPPETFEESFTRLEQTVRALETGRLSLEEATRLFEEGMSLARRCNELLSAAELKVNRLRTAFAEQMQFVPEEDSSADDDEAG